MNVDQKLASPLYIYDENKVRYHLALSKDEPGFNWLFLPGGPGADSRYFLGLVNSLQLPGKSWLIDLPGNGDNPAPENYNFQQWFSVLLPVIQRFDNAIIVGQSFGGMLTLLEPKLESYLKGLVILNSAPSLWFERSAQVYQARNIPEIPEQKQFRANPTQENFDKVLNALLPYWFLPEHLTKGRAFFKDLPFSFNTMLTVTNLMIDMQYTAKWIPQNVKTLIIGGEQDIINPVSLFMEDQRFDRSNIQKKLIPNAGHWCWVEEPEIVKQHFTDFVKGIR